MQRRENVSTKIQLLSNHLTNLKDELFEVLHCWVLLDEEKIGGEIVVSLLKFMGSMVL